MKIKKNDAVLTIILILAVLGCKSTGTGITRKPFSVDLKTILIVRLSHKDVPGEPTGGTVRNTEPLTEKQKDVFIIFPEFPVDVTPYTKLTVKVKYYGAGSDEKSPGSEIKQSNSNVTVTLVYDIHGDKRGPDRGPGPNTPVKESNAGGSSGISTDNGVDIKLTQAPGGMLLHAVNDAVKFIEVTEIIFHD